MYHPTIIDRRLTAQIDLVRRSLPTFEAPALSIPEIEAWEERLDGVYDEKAAVLRRPLEPAEEAFILGQQIRCKSDFAYWAERYAKIRSEDGQLIRIPLRQTQQIILKKLGELELSAPDRFDGVMALVLKARQLGCSTLTELLMLHKCGFYGNLQGLIASDVPTSSARLFDMCERAYENLPWWLKVGDVEHVKDEELYFKTIDSRIMVGSGKSVRGKEGGRGQLGRSLTVHCFHGSEISTWDNASQIDSALGPAMPRNPNTFALLESTAYGRQGWWRDSWDNAVKGLGRYKPIFIPWAVEQEKYRSPAPEGWEPSALTRAHAQKVEGIAREWCGINLHVTKEQLRWYETERAAYIHKRQLHIFDTEFAADPDTCFTSADASAISAEKINNARLTALPLGALVEVNLDPGVDWTRYVAG